MKPFHSNIELISNWILGVIYLPFYKIKSVARNLLLRWMVNNSIPMDRKMKQILNIVVVIVVVLWVGSQFSGFNFLP